MASVELTGLACLRRTPPPLPHNRIHCSRVWCRAQMPPGLDPAAGDLKQARAIRKRLQLFSLASVSMRMVLHLATQRRKSSSSNGDREDIEGGGECPAAASDHRLWGRERAPWSDSGLGWRGGAR